MKYNEMIIISNGKLKYVVTMEEKKKNNSSRSPYIEIYEGKVRFSDAYYSEMNMFDINNEVHRIAKETFTSQLRTSIREQINNLKILEEIFTELNLSECLGMFITAENVKELKTLDRRYVEPLELKGEINYAINKRENG